ncbi:ParA family protein [Streptomyces sp. NPDC092307]|uniref:ParA family protein n=1 Tax=Streptomyces sp. NPDC092307 TaxID=3366013 RepID=UPI0037FAD80C
MDAVRDDVDVVLIDAGPTLGLLTVSAMVAADDITLAREMASGMSTRFPGAMVAPIRRSVRVGEAPNFDEPSLPRGNQHGSDVELRVEPVPDERERGDQVVHALDIETARRRRDDALPLEESDYALAVAEPGMEVGVSEPSSYGA